MYNKPMNFEITSTAPWAADEANDTVIGITVTGMVETNDHGILDDLIINEEMKKGIPIILSGRLPIDKEVSLKFTERKDLRLKFPGCRILKCSLEEVLLHPGLSDGNVKVRLKLKAPNLDSDTAGKIVSHLRQSVALELVSSQKDFFEEEKQKVDKKDDGKVLPSHTTKKLSQGKRDPLALPEPSQE